MGWSCSVTDRNRFFHVISLEPISKRSKSKSFHERSVPLVRIDVTGTFWQAMMRELCDKT